VLRALGLGDELARASLRFGLGRWTTEAEIDYVAKKVTEVVQHLRKTSPLQPLYAEG
jgi:cysteine desulfurase